MGTAVDFLYERGFSAKTKGDRIVVSPASRLTDDVRQFVRVNRLGLLAELTAQDTQERHNAWCITLDGKSLCMLIGEPMTYAEAMDAARWRWPKAEVLQ
jgi:hypothetical protein